MIRKIIVIVLSDSPFRNSSSWDLKKLFLTMTTIWKIEENAVLWGKIGMDNKKGLLQNNLCFATGSNNESILIYIYTAGSVTI